jgi:hypothetical protein
MAVRDRARAARARALREKAGLSVIGIDQARRAPLRTTRMPRTAA